MKVRYSIALSDHFNMFAAKPQLCGCRRIDSGISDESNSILVK